MIFNPALVSILAGGHVLLEGVPGLGKTMLIRTLAQANGVIGLPAPPRRFGERPEIRRRETALAVGLPVVATYLTITATMAVPEATALLNQLRRRLPVRPAQHG